MASRTNRAAIKPSAPLFEPMQRCRSTKDGRRCMLEAGHKHPVLGVIHDNGYSWRDDEADHALSMSADGS